MFLNLVALLVVALTLLVLGSATLTLRRTVSGLSSSTETLTYTDDVGVLASPATVPVAKAGALTTRTNNTSGSLTMNSAGHGISTGQRVDLYWSGGQCYGAVVGTVSGSVVPIASVSGGSNLPSATTAIIVGIATQVQFECIAANLSLLALNCPAARNYFVFNTGSADIAPPVYTLGPSIYTWGFDDPALNPNPLGSSTAAEVWISHADVVSAWPTMSATAITH